MTPQEMRDAEFFTRIVPEQAKWFIDRRNKALFGTETDIKAFMQELQIPFPFKNNTLFWTIIYFARVLIFPQNGTGLEHLTQWCTRSGAKCISHRTDVSKPKRIEFNKTTYIMPVELWWTPLNIPRPILPPIEAEEDDEDYSLNSPLDLDME